MSTALDNGTVGDFRFPRRYAEALVEVREEIFQNDIGVFDGVRTREPKLGYKSVLEGSRHPLHSSLRLGRQGEDHLDTDLVHCARELSWSARRSAPWHMLEDGVAISVQGDRYPIALDHTLHQKEVVPSVLVFTEQCAYHFARSVVDSQQQHELGSIVSKPPVVAAVDLYEHPLTRHALPTNTVLRWTTATWTVQTGVYQYPPQRAASDVYTFSFSQKFAEMSVIGTRIPGLSKTQHFGPCGIRCHVGSPAASVAVSECGRAILSIGRQKSLGMACAHSHQSSCLIYRDMLRQ